MSDSIWTAEHFTEKEMACGCSDCKGVLDARHFDSSLKLAKSLDVVRRIMGVPIVVMSAGRCMKHHLAIYAEMNKFGADVPRLSRHLFFDAADIKMGHNGKAMSGWGGQNMLGMFEALIKLRQIPNGGLGTYADRPNILHYDHGEVRRWED